MSALDAIDRDAFARDLEALRAEIDASLCVEDFHHLRKIERWGRLSTFLGYATAWVAPNPLSALALSLGTFTRWTMVMHHCGHRGYDRVPGVPARYTSRVFAHGARRWIDWLDWIDADAWRHEHNTLHHYRTGEEGDPDQVERNLHALRRVRLPRAVKLAMLVVGICTWKILYYAPSTVRVWLHARRRKLGQPIPPPEETRWFFDPWDSRGWRQWARFLDPRREEARVLWGRCLLPYGVIRFLVVPALFLPFGRWAALSVLVNTVLAEIVTNIHAFVVIVPNHCGDDLYRFDAPIADKAEFYLRQVVGSVNFPGGTDARDFLHGWLGYQIEHHLWPDLPMSKYQQFQPRVQEICERHGVPYVRESVGVRLRKLVAVMLGDASMRVWTRPSPDSLRAD